MSSNDALMWPKKFLLPTLISLFFIASSHAEVAVGKPAPLIEAKLLDSTQTVRVGGESNQVTIVNFWASWCSPCRAEMPAIQAYYDQHKAEGVQILAISMDDPADLAEVRKIAKMYSFPIALKSEANFKGLGRIWRMPSTFVIDKHGVLRKNGHEGTPSVDRESLEATVTPLLRSQ